MDKNELFGIEEEKEDKSNHHHSHHHGHRNHKKHKSEGEIRNSAAKKARMLKVFGRGAFFVMIAVLLVLVIWAILSPNEETKKAASREENVTQKVREEIRVEELQAEIESLKKELDEYEEKIEELEEKLVLAGVEQKKNDD